MYLPLDKAEFILRMLLEGNSISSVIRLTETHQKTILKLLVLAGEKCERVMGRYVRNVKVHDIQADEIWGFVKKKEAHKRPAEAHDNSIGDAYTFVAIERDSKLVVNFALGRRDTATTQIFIEGLRDAIAPGDFQITTDGFGPYVPAIDDTLGDRVDFAQLIKVYANNPEGQRRYSTPEVVETTTKIIIGSPDEKRICTSHVERQNLTMRMHMRRLTRLTNGFSKKWENLWAMLCLYFAWYNFVKIHSTLRITPAMAAGITERVWDVLELLEAA
jgi:IS1 family transposase